VLYLGFLKFLKRDKRKEPKLEMENLEGLDMPPVHPDFGEKGIENLPELPELPEMGGEEPFPASKGEPIPDLELPPEEPLPELNFPKEKPVSGLELPELPKLEGDAGMLKEAPKIPPLSKPLFGMQKPKPIFGVQKLAERKPKVEIPEVPKFEPEMKSYERLERAAVREERAVLKHEKAEDTIYIRVDRYRGILTGTNTIKNNLKTASQSIEKLNEIDVNRDIVLEKWHNVLTDLQKKFIFIDKTLFKR